MKWFDAGRILFTKFKHLDTIKALLLFPITLIMFIGILMCFLLFGLSYSVTFCLELLGIKNDSNINDSDNNYIKISKIIFTVILSPFIFLGHMILVVCYFPMGIFSLWTDTLSFLVCKNEGASFNISKTLLTFNR